MCAGFLIKEEMEKVQFDPQKIIVPALNWYDINKRNLPWRGTKDPYRIWISEIMLQQTRVEAVIGYYERFLVACPDIPALASIEDDALMKLWQGLGYYSRARNLKKAAIVIEEKFDGRMPENEKDIRSLPGIGDYTAGAIASIAFDLPVPAVDGNVLRIMARLRCDDRDILKSATKKSVQNDLFAVMPKKRSGELNQAFMDIGASICLPNGAPHCDICPWADICLARQEGRTDELPVRKKAKARRIEERTIIVIRDGERFLLHKRPERGLLAGLYEPINIEGKMDESGVIDVVRALGLDPLRIEALSDAKHIFSHIEWQMKGYEVRVADAADYVDRDGYLLVEAGRIREGFSVPSAYAAFLSER